MFDQVLNLPLRLKNTKGDLAHRVWTWAYILYSCVC